jgi:hypothetical protein
MYQAIPKDTLPTEYGGKAGTVKDIVGKISITKIQLRYN